MKPPIFTPQKNPTSYCGSDLGGKKYGRWTVLSFAGRGKLSGTYDWNCVCDCGTHRVVRGTTLVRGKTNSCGLCRFTLGGETPGSRKHGMSRSPEYKMLSGAKKRALRKGIPFDISLDDIVIPDKCPVLGIELRKSTDGKPHPESPSLDRIVPSLGYTKGNVEVISLRANSIKQNASADEILAVGNYCKLKESLSNDKS